ncbi:MAG: hypothetical protein J6S24_10875, partial [Lentisphaeria bacterium]|nr:hypothetical protein [Lentisphaeria bacterium]
MLKYILRRMGYSVFIIIGVVMMTFVLFRMGAGDPAAAALGKDARPQEIDSLRRKLGSDLPLFFGYLCRSEAYSSRILPQEVVFTRNFPDEGVVLRVKSNCRKREIEVNDASPEVTVKLDAAEKIVSAEVFRRQKNPFNSQFIRTFSEIVSFKKSFPYVSFFDFGETLSTGEPIKDILKR